MKKLILFALAAGCCACATTGSTDSAANFNAQTITLEQAMEKSAATRQQLLDAKQQYQQAKLAAEVAAGKKTTTQAAQETVQNKIDAAKKQLQNEKDAWADLLK